MYKNMDVAVQNWFCAATSNFIKSADILWTNFNVVCFLLGNSPVSEFYVPMFRNTLSVPSSYLPTYEDGTDRVFRNVGI